MSRIEDAVKKINLDIQKEPDNGYIAAVGEYIIDCITSEEAADAVLTEGKTLSGALEEIRNAMEGKARKRYNGTKASCVEIAVPKEDVFKMAREYFGLHEAGGRPMKKGVSLSLEDFL